MTATSNAELRRCSGCGLQAADGDVVAPSGYDASAGCWSQFGMLLACSYSDPAYARVHQLAVDTYIVQHPTSDTRQQVQRVGLCLMTLCLFIESDVDIARGPALHKQMVANRPDFHALDPPRTDTLMTVADVLTAQDADAHERLVRAWATQVWRAWQPHHATVRRWNRHVLP